MKSIFKIYLAFIMLITASTFADNLPDETQKESTALNVCSLDVSITLNFVNLSMDRKVETFTEHQLNNKFYFDEASPIDVNKIKDLKIPSYRLSRINFTDKQLQENPFFIEHQKSNEKSIFSKVTDMKSFLEEVPDEIFVPNNIFALHINSKDYQKNKDVLKDKNLNKFEVVVIDKIPENMYFVAKKIESRNY